MAVRQQHISRMRRLYFILLVAFAAQLGCAGRVVEPPLPSAPTAFTAVVRSAEARFVFPTSVRRDWNWPQVPPTPADPARFAWGVTVVDGDSAYLVGAATYQAHHPAPLAGLEDVVRAAVADLAAIAPHGHVQQKVRDADVRVHTVDGRVVITLRGRATVARVFAARPARVRFGVLAPTAPHWWTDSVAVTYAER